MEIGFNTGISPNQLNSKSLRPQVGGRENPSLNKKSSRIENNQVNKFDKDLSRASQKAETKYDKNNALSSSVNKKFQSKEDIKDEDKQNLKANEKSEINYEQLAQTNSKINPGAPNTEKLADEKISDSLDLSFDETVGDKLEYKKITSPIANSLKPNSNHRAVLSEFMTKMQAELGIEPDQWIKALSSLNTEQLSLPPEKSLPLVVEKLNLNPAEHEKALELVAEMLKKRSEVDLAENLKKTGKSAEIELLTEKQSKQRQTEKGIISLQNSFLQNQNSTLVQPPAMPAKPNPKMVQSAYEKFSPQTFQTQNQQNQNPKIDLTSAEAKKSQASPEMDSLEGLKSLEKNEFNLTEFRPKDLNNLKTSESILDFNSSRADSPVEFNSESNTKSDSNTNSETNENGTSNSESSNQNFSASSEQLEVLLEKIEKMDPIAKDSTEARDTFVEASTKNEIPSVTVESFVNKTQNTEKQNPDFVTSNAEANRTEEQQNIREIIKQATTSIRNGGGEMKIRLTPEGLGEVHLKVVTDQGKVQVEMVASTKEAKKLLESGLSDLKTTLLSHKLNVDNIKVETPQEIAKQLIGQNQQNAEKNLAQNFMQQFRDTNQEFRRGMFDIPGARNYRSQRSDELTSKSPSQKRSASERRLDLVA